MQARTLKKILQYIPANSTSSLLSHVGYFLHERSHHRREIHQAIASALHLHPEDPRVHKLVKDNFKHLLQTIFEITRFDCLKEQWSDLVVIEGMENYWEVINKGQGVILFSGHVGNWELLISALPLLGIDKPYALGWRQPESDLNSLLDQQRLLWGTQILWAQDFSEKEVEAILTNGGTLYMMNDRFEQGKTKVQLFGHPTGTPAGPVLFARRYNAALIPVHTYRADKKHHIVFEAPLQLQPLKANSDLTADLQLCMSIIEGWISQRPDQWIWIFKRGEWKMENQKTN